MTIITFPFGGSEVQLLDRILPGADTLEDGYTSAQGSKLRMRGGELSRTQNTNPSPFSGLFRVAHTA